MTSKETKQVLAFYPNALGFGFVFMENALSLKSYQTVVIRPMCNKRILKRIAEYVDYYEPDIVVLEDVSGNNGSRKSKRVKKLISQIQNYITNKNLKVHTYSREQIRFVFSQFEARSKHDIATILAEHIQELKKHLRPKRKIFQAESHTMGIFDAVALATTHYYHTD